MATMTKKPVEIIRCNCKSAFQDEKYGPSMRVHNCAKPLDATKNSYNCTVCGREKSK